MSPEEMARECDDLHECIDQGPGENPQGFARCLTIVRRLRAAASWNYPINILNEVETLLARWVSPRGQDEEETYRGKMLVQISRLEDAWERPNTYGHFGDPNNIDVNLEIPLFPPKISRVEQHADG